MFKPEKHMKASAIRPTVMNVMPSPFSGSGTSVYAIFSLMAASPTIASVHPIPEPAAYATASPTLVIACVLAGSITILCCMKSEAPMMAQLTAISGRKIPKAAYNEGENL